MFIPALAVLIMRVFFRDKVKNAGWRKLPLKWIFPALLFIPFAIHLVGLPLVAILNDMTIPWQDWLAPDETGLFHAPEELGWGEMTSRQLIYRFSINALVGLVIVSILAFFEEIGWRVWLLPRLIYHFSVKKGVLISAVIWAVWHIPFVFGGMNVIPGISLGAMLLLYPIGLIGAGIVIGWLWIKSRSIWIVCLAHGALNNWGQYAFKYMKDGPTEPMGWPWLYTGVNMALILLGIVILLTWRTKND